MVISNITVGADPELFIVNTETKKVVSAVGLIPGQKGEPYQADDMPNGFGMETDNILAEFNIPPVTSRNAFINNIEYMKDYINKFVKAKDSRLGIMCAASAKVPLNQLQSKQAREFGCSPDYNVYTQEANPKPHANKTTTRSAGFHIHVGYRHNNIDTSLTLIKVLDAFLGLPSVLKDPDTERRSLYGRAGCFRLTPYGFEYRVLSGAMMKDADTIGFVWDQLIRAIHLYNVGSINIPDTSETRCAINDSDEALAKRLIARYHIIA